MEKQISLYEKLNTLIYFRNILHNNVIISLKKLLKSSNCGDKAKISKRYSQFISLLFQNNIDISVFIQDLIKSDSNIFIRKYAEHNLISDSEKDAVYRDIEILQQICDLKSVEFKDNLQLDASLPDWENTPINLMHFFKNYLQNINVTGYGIFSKYYVFKMSNKLLPISNPDTISLKDLTGYQKQREKIILNTKALINGYQASNILLYGDSGTGKSSSIKAVANEYYNQGLRLIEISQTKLHKLPVLIEMISQEPLKFIIFIDDLSFAKENKDFSALKAILEGSTIKGGTNCVIYATSNRRHLIKENFSDRGDNDIHANETIQQLTALSDRFGLKINFGIPDKKNYLNIVDNLLNAYNLNTDTNKLHREAEAFAILQGNRSPRTAKQFIQQYMNDIIK